MKKTKNLDPYTYFANVVSVYDADTITVNLDYGFNNWALGMVLRLGRINANEVRLSKNTSKEEKALGLKARDFLREWILWEKVIIKTSISDKIRGKYGRVIAEVFAAPEKDNSGDSSGFVKWVNVNDRLVKLGYAVYQEY